VVSLRESPEIVLLGSTTAIKIPEFLMLPSGLMIKPDSDQGDQLRISRFQVGQEDKRAIVPNSVASVIGGIVSVGGGYGDVISALRMAKDKGYLKDQLAIDPLPWAMRTYYRDEDESQQPPTSSERTADLEISGQTL
jgi:hypothetical protein